MVMVNMVSLNLHTFGTGVPFVYSQKKTLNFEI